MPPTLPSFLPLIGAVVLLAGCSGSGSSGPHLPAVSAFTAGTCRAVAPDLLQISRDSRRLGTGGDIDPKVLATLADAQTRIGQVAPGAEPSYKPALTRLAVSVGLIRLQARVGSYTSQQGHTLQHDADAAITTCTATPPR